LSRARHDEGTSTQKRRLHRHAFSAYRFVICLLLAKGVPFEVDLRLVLAVDVSSSMTEDEHVLQREGYARALRSPDVLWAIKSGWHGRIAITLFEWGRPNYQHVVVPWTVIANQEDAEAFANAVAGPPSSSEGLTSISAALSFAADLLQSGSVRGVRQVVDVSGDGPDNAGPPIQPARDALLQSGVTINGLVIALSHSGDRMFDLFGPYYVESYYEGCVIGGPGAFLVSVSDTAEFERAIRRKLAIEIAGVPQFIERATYDVRYPPDTDCR
jgi:hypothetical protein